MTLSATQSRKTTLIHDLNDYVNLVWESIHDAVEKKGFLYDSTLTPKNIVKWIIAKEFWQAYHITMVGNNPELDVIQDTLSAIHHESNMTLNGRLTEYTLAYIPSLKVLDPYREMSMEIYGRDLHIVYYGQVTNELYNLSSWKMT
jgi:hypothetical protein